MGDGKVGSLIGKAIFEASRLWAIQKVMNSGVSACVAVVVVQVFLLNIKKFSSPNVLVIAK